MRCVTSVNTGPTVLETCRSDISYAAQSSSLYANHPGKTAETDKLL